MYALYYYDIMHNIYVHGYLYDYTKKNSFPK